MSVQMKWQGAPEMKRTFTKTGEALDDRTDEVKNVLMVPSKAAMDRASVLAPKKTGLLSESMYATKGGPRMRGIKMGIKKKAWYARFVEFGTSKMAAHPFFRPAVLAMNSTYIADIAPGIKNVVESTCAKYAYRPGR